MGLAASALPALEPSDAWGAVPRPGRAGCVVFESASPLAAAFGQAARRLGLRAHAIRDDVTDLWYYEFAPRWKEAPATIAGITLSTSLFCLETLAADHGMRAGFRLTHGPLADGHRAWAREFAAFVAGVPGALAGLRETAAGRWTGQDQEPGPVISWIIAPRARS